jgi:hypothetical protein
MGLLMRTHAFFLLTLLLSLTASAETMTLGRVETGLISEQCIPMRIRMDTGANTSSVSAHNIKIFEKNNQQWVQFILDPDRTSAIHQFELPLVRTVKIRKRAAESKPGDDFERRYVVMMPLTLGNQTESIEVTLANRSYFNYGMLMGRSGMEQFKAIIDPSLAFIHKPHCPSENEVVN